jgi:RsiW-degrading membrane proteinase PrsW (M82 family)
MLAFFFEAITIAGFVLVGFLYLNSQPELLTEVEKLIEPANSGLFNSGQSMRTLSLLLEDPFIVALLVAYLSLAVPLIEELLKPLGVWLLLGRPLTGSQGFALGILGGAGFGLFENLTLGATPVDWTLTNTLRIGATALHMATGGLVGWAIVRAKNERRYLQFLATYGASVFLHGLWNAMAIVYTRNSLATFTESASLRLDSPPILVLSLLSVVCFALLIINNRDLRREQNQPSAE